MDRLNLALPADLSEERIQFHLLLSLSTSRHTSITGGSAAFLCLSLTTGSGVGEGEGGACTGGGGGACTGGGGGVAARGQQLASTVVICAVRLGGGWVALRLSS